MHIIKEFKMEVPPFGNMITEMFGIDGGYNQRICDLEVPEDYEILYITGESGSGKSVLLNELFPNYTQETIPTTPLFLWGGETLEQQTETMRILTLVGISDAILFINTYNNLSDSQKARARIALEIMSNKSTIVVDEFLSTLDRKTAKPVAYCIQKAIRSLGKKLVVATAHEDLGLYLKPNYIISGSAFPSEFVCEKSEWSKDNPIINDVELVYGDKNDYRNLRLGELHYKGKYTGGTKEYLFAKYDDRIIGVLVSTYNRSTGGRRISRVVVHPSYRGIGVGQALVKKYIREFDSVDVIAAMGLINPVFEKAGMTRVANSIIKSPKGLEKSLISLGLDTTLWGSPSWCHEVCQDEKVRSVLSTYAKYASDLVCPGGKYLPVDEVETKIKNDATTAGRVLYGLRKRELAKYILKK